MFTQSIAQLEKALDAGQAREMLASALVLLDLIGAEIAAAHVSQAIDRLNGQFNLEEIRSKSVPASQLPVPGS
jgi:hypothetical protein